MEGVIYLITNLTTGRYYVGQSISFQKRISQHRNTRSSKTPIGHAIKKYGWNNFSVEIIGSAERGEALDNLEKLWIAISNSVDRNVGYNLRFGGSTSPCTAETRNKISAAKIGKKQSPEQIAARVALQIGRKRPDVAARCKTPEMRAKISASLKGIHRSPHTPEVMQRILATKKRLYQSKTACKHGHAYTEENTYFANHGSRGCKICREAAKQRYAERLRCK